MSLRMELRDRDGTVLGVAGETYDTIDATLPELSFDSFPMLAGIDRYGETMFNRLQLSQVAVELERLLESSPPKRAKMLREVIQLCRAGATKSGAQLWVAGD
jgi:hypothetical protein